MGFASIIYSNTWFTDVTLRNNTTKRAECFHDKRKNLEEFVIKLIDLAQTKRVQLSTNGILLIELSKTGAFKVISEDTCSNYYSPIYIMHSVLG